jgi:putative DNA primase/helicase
MKRTRRKRKKPDLKRFAAEFAAWEAQRDGILAAIKQAGKTGKPVETLRVALVELDNSKPQAPRVPSLIRGDDTPEKLAWVVAREWPSAGVMSSEAGPFSALTAWAMTRSCEISRC